MLRTGRGRQHALQRHAGIAAHRRGGKSSSYSVAAREAAAAPGDDAEGGGAVELAGAALEGSVAYWSDYAKALLHPRSTLLLPGVWHGVHACDGYGDSRDFVGGETGEAARDSLRRAPAAAWQPHRALAALLLLRARS